MKKLIFVIILIFISFSIFAGQITVYSTKGMLAVGVDGKIYGTPFFDSKWGLFAPMPVKAIAITRTTGRRVYNDDGALYNPFIHGYTFALGDDGAVYILKKAEEKFLIFGEDKEAQFVLFAKLPENVKAIDISSYYDDSSGTTGIVVLGDDGMLYGSFRGKFDLKFDINPFFKKLATFPGGTPKNKRKYSTGQIIQTFRGLIVVGNDGKIYCLDNERNDERGNFLPMSVQPPVKAIAISYLNDVFYYQVDDYYYQVFKTYGTKKTDKFLVLGYDSKLYIYIEKENKFVLYSKILGNVKGVDLAGYQTENIQDLFIVGDDGIIYRKNNQISGAFEKFKKMPGESPKDESK